MSENCCSISEALALHDSFVLLGDPGSGKTTTLKKLQLDRARQAQQNPESRIPLFFRLSEWPEHILDIPSLLLHAGQLQGLPPIHFNKLLILLDGLNEIAAQSYIERVKMLEAWLKTNPKVSVVISCREKHYLNSKRLSIPEVLVSPFDNLRIQLFLNAYLGSDAGGALLPQLGELEVEKRSQRDLIHLAHNPYLLSLICYVYACNEAKLPESRGDLFRLFVKTLYKREQDLQETQSLSYERLLEAFSDIAFEMQVHRSSTSVHKAWAKKQVSKSFDCDVLWELGREASLLEFVKDEQILQFTHQLILEYFAAEGLLLKRFSRLGEFIRKPVFSRNQRMNDRWDEVVFTLVGITEPNVFLMKLAEIDPFLAMDCFEHIPKNLEPSQKTVIFIVNHLISFFESENADARIAAVQKVLLLKSEGLSELLKFFETSCNPVAKRACLSALAKIDDPFALKTLILALDDKTKWVRKDAEDLLTGVDKIKIKSVIKENLVSVNINKLYKLGYIIDKNIEEFIVKYRDSSSHDEVFFLLEHKNVNIRTLAMQYSINYIDSLPHDKVFTLLKSNFNNIRLAAIKNLSKFDDSLSMEKLLSVLDSEFYNVRLMAITTIIKFNYNIPSDKLLPLLNDENDTVKRAAILAIPQAESSLPIDKLLFFLNDNNISIRRVAIEVFLKFEDALSVDILLPLLGSKYFNVKIMAIETLAKFDDVLSVDKLLPLLEDKNEEVRLSTLKTLSKLSKWGGKV